MYDPTGNLTYSPDPTASQLACTYDAQNRLLTASKNGVSMGLAYDGLNRQVSRTVTSFNIGGSPTYNVWDGWDLIEEYQVANNGAATASYLYGATGLIGAGTANGQFNYYFQDGSSSTSHVTDEKGLLQEWYRYDLQGTPLIYDANNNQLSASNRSVRHLFTGQQWYADVGLYDLRNRFYSPDIGRFLQPDPSGFNGDPTNLYRYCKNNPVTRIDPVGLEAGEPGGEAVVDRVVVSAPFLPEWFFNPNYSGPGPNFLGNQAPSNLIPWGWMLGPYSGLGLGGFGSGWGGTPFRLPENDQLGVEHSLLSSVPSQNAISQAPQSVGYLGSFAAEAGLGEGATLNGSIAFGDFGSDNGAPNYGSFKSYGGFLGGPSGAAQLVDSNQKNFVLGGAVGPSVGIWFSNATAVSNVMGPFSGYFVSTPWANASFSVSGNRYYIITVTYPGSGLSYSQYTTNTTPVGH